MGQRKMNDEDEDGWGGKKNRGKKGGMKRVVIINELHIRKKERIVII